MTRVQECEIEAAAFLEKASLAASPYQPGGPTLLRQRVEKALDLCHTAKARLDEVDALRAAAAGV